MKTPIMLITGSLGSGKTTLLKNILETTDRRLAVLMNEFGEIAIDGKIIAGKDVQMIELAGGCVCCSLTGEFESAIREILREAAPEFIVVEATGVAEADALVFEVEDNLPEVRLDSVVCIVDGYLSIKHPYMGYTSRSQLESADIVLINKVDLVTSGEIAEVEAQIRKYNRSSVLFKTIRCDLDTRLLFGPDAGRHRTISHLHSSMSEIQSFVYATNELLNEERFRQVVDELPPTVYRAKGFVDFGDGGRLFNYVAGRTDLEKFRSDRTELVFIGLRLDDVKDDILSRLQECEVRYAL